jgi:hypothetical protein
MQSYPDPGWGFFCLKFGELKLENDVYAIANSGWFSLPQIWQNHV